MSYKSLFRQQNKKQKNKIKDQFGQCRNQSVNIFKQQQQKCVGALIIQAIASNISFSICWDILTNLVYLKLKLWVICIQSTAESEQRSGDRQNWGHFITRKEEDLIEYYNQHDSKKKLVSCVEWRLISIIAGLSGFFQLNRLKVAVWEYFPNHLKMAILSKSCLLRTSNICMAF